MSSPPANLSPLEAGPARRHARRAAVGLGRLGIIARGILYMLIGTLALLAAAHLQRARGPKGTLIALIAYPGGRAVVILLAMGFAAFAISHMLAILLERRNTWRAWFRRFVSFCLALTYASLTVSSATLAVYRQGDSEVSTRSRVGWLLTLPGGRALLVAIALGIAGFGAFEWWRAFSNAPRRELPAAGWLLRSCWRAGVAARGTLFLGIAALLARVAFDNDARNAGGVGTTLQALARHSAARPILIALGVGLVAFGLAETVAAARGNTDPLVKHQAEIPPAAS
jgi:hypothetical protein